MHMSDKMPHKISRPTRYKIGWEYEKVKQLVAHALTAVGYPKDSCIIERTHFISRYRIAYRYTDLDELLDLYGSIIDIIKP